MSNAGVNFTEKVEVFWDAYLEEFMRESYPTFKKHGLSRDTAILVWMLNKINNNVTDVEDAIRNLEGYVGE